MTLRLAGRGERFPRKWTGTWRGQKLSDETRSELELLYKVAVEEDRNGEEET